MHICDYYSLAIKIFLYSFLHPYFVSCWLKSSFLGSGTDISCFL
ncbi:hypothetical protein AM1_5134 [Acaryochloris marina MBIC11017]|uniref:Uncharacterized protein n=1 Tax=Acaryochloris marina (strain MBIC 11017) TaxID=329726 RepID=B0C8E1_ACAM1|nr:hypothetical protein AM1_5134 [Acaryochloris marina MBIC11017]